MLIEGQQQKYGLKLGFSLFDWAETIRRSSNSMTVYRGFSHSPKGNSKFVTEFQVETFPLLRCYKKRTKIFGTLRKAR